MKVIILSKPIGLKMHLLNFKGRVHKGSKKNFQLVPQNNKDDIILQFGKKRKHHYSMDLSYPLSPVQAFGIVLSTLAAKLASE